jgi:hypothetical protein
LSNRLEQEREEEGVGKSQGQDNTRSHSQRKEMVVERKGRENMTIVGRMAKMSGALTTGRKKGSNDHAIAHRFVWPWTKAVMA